MADFESAVNNTLKREGGNTLTNDPKDAGGLTKFGISQRAYPNVAIARLSLEQAKAIYKKDYWDKILGDKIVSQSIAGNLFDTAVNMGVKTANRITQEIVNVTVDGVVGPQTLAALNQTDEEIFLLKFTIAKIQYYVDIVNRKRSQKKFLLGWLNRALHRMSS